MHATMSKALGDLEGTVKHDTSDLMVEKAFANGGVWRFKIVQITI